MSPLPGWYVARVVGGAMGVERLEIGPVRRISRIAAKREMDKRSDPGMYRVVKIVGEPRLVE